MQEINEGIRPMNLLLLSGNRVADAKTNKFFTEAPVCGVTRIIGYALGVNANSATTDNAIDLKVLPGANFIVTKVQLNNASISLTTATASLYTATGGSGGSGTALVADAALSAMTSTTYNLVMTLAAAASNTVLNQATLANNLYFRIGTAQGAAATVDVYIWGEVLP
jgi:hypothetical protein